VGEERALLVGKLAVQAAFEGRHRSFHRLYVSETLPARRSDPFTQEAASRDVPIETLSPSSLTDLCGIQNHGGVVAEVGPRTLMGRKELLEAVRSLEHAPLLFAFEGFHDARNFGYALRCVEAFGADGVFVTPRSWGREDAVISQSSSGAYDRMRIAPLEDTRSLLKELEDLGIEAIAATAGAYRSFYDFNLRAPVLIAVGGEFRGLSDEMKKACHHAAHLPMTDAIPSFPASHAAAILASEAARQRRATGPPGPLWPQKKPSNLPSRSPSSTPRRPPRR
jgi:tRNA G18 (ribose-2'-O)-methylase SpoU